MHPLEFLLGEGWLRAWYLLFYAGMVPMYGFLRILRRPKTRRQRSTLLLVYALASSLLLLFTGVHTFAYLVGIDAGVLRKILIALGSTLLFCTLIWSVIPLLLRRSDSKLIIAGIHLLLVGLILGNLLSLWMMQNRPMDLLIPAASHSLFFWR